MKSWGKAGISALMVVIGTVSHATDDELKKILEGRYGELKAAMAAHDPDAVGQLLAPGFASIDLQGKSESADQMLSEVEALTTDPNKVSTTTLEAIELVSDTATVRQTYHMTTVKADKNAVNHNVELTTISDDTWVLVDGQWLILKTVTKDIAYYSDNKLVVHKTAP